MTLQWKPMTERPNTPATGLIRHTDHEGAHLIPGPVMYDIRQRAWCDESTGDPVTFNSPGDYHWIYEDEVLA